MGLLSSLPSKPKENRAAGSHRADSPQSRVVPLSLSTAPASTLKALVGVRCRKAQHHLCWGDHVSIGTPSLAHHRTSHISRWSLTRTRCAEVPQAMPQAVEDSRGGDHPTGPGLMSWRCSLARLAGLGVCGNEQPTLPLLVLRVPQSKRKATWALSHRTKNTNTNSLPSRAHWATEGFLVRPSRSRLTPSCKACHDCPDSPVLWMVLQSK